MSGLPRFRHVQGYRRRQNVERLPEQGIATDLRRSAPPFRAVVKRRSRGLQGAVLLFDVLLEDADGCSADGAGEVGPGPEFIGAAVVLA